MFCIDSLLKIVCTSAYAMCMQARVFAGHVTETEQRISIEIIMETLIDNPACMYTSCDSHVDDHTITQQQKSDEKTCYGYV